MNTITIDGAATTPTHPGEEFRNLDVFEGEWTVSGMAEGREIFKWMEGGHFLMYSWEREFQGKRHAGQGVIGYDNRAGRYFMNTYDSLGYARIYEVRLSPSTMEILGPHERALIVVEHSGHLRAHWEQHFANGEWETLCELDGRRAADRH